MYIRLANSAVHIQFVSLFFICRGSCHEALFLEPQFRTTRAPKDLQEVMSFLHFIRPGASSIFKKRFLKPPHVLRQNTEKKNKSEKLSV